ncbi:MAG: hypothetical protein JRH13_05725 [Deltaproteobacteria bacterium]|nr:hypothetical protein [Deltaproteobacteria bacterium]MBW2128844.1 hypothetical protein [Deltaproteobacteria bacterium]
MNTGRLRQGSLFIILFLILCLTGCGTVKGIYRKISPEKIYKKVTFQAGKTDSLKKRVLMLPILDQARLGKQKLEKISHTFISMLSKDERLLIYPARDPIPTTLKLRNPEFGIVTDPDRARKAEEMGMNVLLTVIINPLEFRPKKKSFWPLRVIWPFGGANREVEISMFVNALDITNGTLILSHLEIRKLDLIEDLMAWEEEDEAELRKSIDEKELQKAFADMLEGHVEALREALDRHPWSGRILSVNDGKVIISAGKDVGIEAGEVFEVYGRGDPVRSASGRTYYLLGPKIGEVKAEKVMDSYASAVPLSEGKFQAGYLVRPVKN